MNMTTISNRLSWMIILLPVALLLSQRRLSAQRIIPPLQSRHLPTVEAPKDRAAVAIAAKFH